MAKPLTVQQFFKMYPTDDACLAHLMATRFGDRVKCPRCGKEGRFVRLRNEPAYCCPTPRCGHHLHPMKDTPFEKTHTGLQKWFYAMYLFCSSRHGVSAKELQRQLGVTYKTAWRMGHEIRKYMAIVDGDGGPTMQGYVEIDETYIGGRQKGAGRGTGIRKGKAVVFGILQRGGDVITRVIRKADRKTVDPIIYANVRRNAIVSTDEAGIYRHLASKGYRHGVVNHNADEWVKGVHHTNTIENFWSILKRSIRGTHVWVSRKHLSKYLGEFEYRYNLRKTPHAMFDRLLAAFPQSSRRVNA